MHRFKKYALISLAFIIILYAVAVANPGTVLSRKACSSWSLVKDQAFVMTHPRQDGSQKLPANFLIQPGTAEQVPVLMYHYITPQANNDQPDNNSIITLEAFEENMNYLHEQGYYTATMEELEQYVLGKTSLPAKTVVITFDDGYQNNYIYAYPILKNTASRRPSSSSAAEYSKRHRHLIRPKRASSPLRKSRPLLTYLNTTATRMTCITKGLRNAGWIMPRD